MTATLPTINYQDSQLQTISSHFFVSNITVKATFWLATLKPPGAVHCLIQRSVGSRSESHLACKLAGLSTNKERRQLLHEAHGVHLHANELNVMAEM